MHPDLLKIGPVTIHSYGTMIVIGFFLGLLLIKKRVSNYNLKWEDCLDLSFSLLLGGILGAKFLYWVIFPQQFIVDISLFKTDFWAALKGLGSGFVFFGALIGGIIVFLFETKRKNMPIKDTLDLITPSVPLAHAFGRIGCFLAGCCYGKSCSEPWAVVFKNPDSLAPQGIPIHPTQLYESAYLFCIAIFLLLVEKKIRKIPGRVLLIYTMLYSVGRFIIEFFRGDPRGSCINGYFSTTQCVAVVIALISVIVYFHLTKKSLKQVSNE